MRHILLFFLTILTTSHLSAQTKTQPLSGTYTIGGSGAANYATVDAAIQDVTTRGVIGPVIFQIESGSYNDNESPTIGAITGVSASNTVTFQSASGNAADVILGTGNPNNNWVLLLDNARFVNFQDITFTTTNANSGRIISLNEAADIVIRNCIFNGSVDPGVTQSQLIYSLKLNSVLPSNFLIEGNTFNNGAYGINLIAIGASTQLNNNRIVNNRFIDQSEYGVNINNAEGCYLSGNEITTSAAGNEIFGIYINAVGDSVNISNNRIALADGVGIAMIYSGDSQSSRGLIANNFVKIGSGGAESARGLNIYSSVNFDIFHNTVLIQSSHATESIAFLTDDDGTDLTIDNNVRNNIFSNPNANGVIYAVNASANISVCENNIFDRVGSTTPYSWGGTQYDNLIDLQTATTSNLTSVEKAVSFINGATGDLHLNGASKNDLDLIVPLLAEVSTDIDNDPRDPLFPFAGADEGTIILPVELTSFSAQVEAGAALLSWSTATETDNFGFQVERRREQNEWQKIGFVGGAGTTAQTQTYSFRDQEVVSGKYFYRLKQIDRDGGFEYSSSIEIMMGTSENSSAPFQFSLSANYPNPFNPATTIKYSIPQSGKVKLMVFDLLGNRVASLINKNIEAGEHKISFNAGNMASGVYFYRIESPGFVMTRKMLFAK